MADIEGLPRSPRVSHGANWRAGLGAGRMSTAPRGSAASRVCGKRRAASDAASHDSSGSRSTTAAPSSHLASRRDAICVDVDGGKDAGPRAESSDRRDVEHLVRVGAPQRAAHVVAT